MAASHRREPWPFIVAGLLGTMITVSLLFLWTAIAHPDPPVVEDAYRAGLRYAERLAPPALPPAEARAAPAGEPPHE